MKQKSESQKRYIRLSNLIKACLDRFSEDEILEAFNNITGNEYGEDLDNDEMVSKLSIEGYCIFKPDSTSKAEQLREYAETNIFPYYNEQQTSILY